MRDMHEIEPLLPSADGTPMSLKSATANIRRGFVRKVYGILSAQLIVTVLIGVPFQWMTVEQIKANQWLMYVPMFGVLCTMMVMCCCHEQLRIFPQNYIILGLLTVFEGLLVGWFSALYTWQSVLLAAGITTAIFIGMTIYAWNTKTDFTGFAPYLFGALLCLCIFGFVISILVACGVKVKMLMMIYDCIAVLIFTFYIVFDTQMVIGGNHQYQFSVDDYCFAAISLYLDIIQLFVHLLSLFGDRR